MQEIINYFDINFHENPAIKCPNNCNCYKDCRRCLQKQYFHNILLVILGLPVVNYGYSFFIHERQFMVYYIIKNQRFKYV